LPKTQISISANGEIAWASDICAGIRFSQIAANAKAQLDQWLIEQMAKLGN
jgi:hypothetical protein